MAGDSIITAVPRHRPRSPATPRRPPRTAGLAAALLLAAIAAYAPAAGHQFVNIDDPQYVFENPRVTGGLTAGAAAWAFTSSHAGNWHPLTWISHMADVELFGLDAGAHHAVNIAFHAAGTLLLFLALVRLTGAAGPSAFAAGLFALHPLHVESVAWIAERKDVLSTCFWLLAMLAYARYAAARSARGYAMVTAAFACALLSKPTAVTLPLALLLVDAWPLARRDRRAAILEKLPWLAMSAAVGVITILVQGRAGAVSPLDALPLSTRVANAGLAYVSYIRMMIWPSDLAPLYPYDVSQPAATAAGAWLVVAAVTALVIRFRREAPAAAMGWAWYLITLVPMIGLIQVGIQPRADRYTYVPMIGLFVAIAWLARDLAARLALPRRAVQAAAVAVLAALGVLTWRQTGVWRDSITLWTHAVEAHGNVAARANLGQALSVAGRWHEALPVLEEAVRANPRHPEAHQHLGFALDTLGHPDLAIDHFREAVRLRPAYLEAHGNLGVALAQRGDLEAALVHLREVLRLDPSSARGRANLALALATLGDIDAQRGNRDAALAAYREALSLAPGNRHLQARLSRLEADR